MGMKLRGIKLNKSQKKLLDTLVFMLKLLAFAIPLYAVMSFEGIMLPLQEVVSSNVHSLLQYMGFNAARDGFLIKSGGIAFFVSEDCTGWKSMLFLAALMFAVPGVRMRKRLIGVAVGIPAIYAGNLLRILAVVLVWHNYGPAAAGLVHDYFWQAGLISLVLALWISWLAWAGKIRFPVGKTLIRRDHKINKTGKRAKGRVKFRVKK